MTDAAADDDDGDKDDDDDGDGSEEEEDEEDDEPADCKRLLADVFHELQVPACPIPTDRIAYDKLKYQTRIPNPKPQQ